MRTRTVVLAVAGTTVAAMIISACGTSGHSSTPHAAVGEATAAAGAGGAATFGGADLQSLNGTANSAGGTRAASVPSVSGGTGTADATNGSGSGTLISANESVIRKAELTVGVKKASDVAVQANAAEAIVYKLGGDVFGDDRQSGTDATATLTLLVPPADLTKALTELSALGVEQSRDLSSQNVTTQVADVNARLISANASIATLRTLFHQATKVGDVIEIEQELASRESDLESLEAQQKALNDETSQATISLVLTTAPAPVVPKPPHHSSGIGGAFSRGWDHFISAGAWVISAIAAVGPWVVLALLVGAGLLRARRRRPASPTPAPDPA